MKIDTAVAPRMREQQGFTIIEMLVAVAVLMVVVAVVCSLLDPAQGTFQAQPQVSDLQQRLRVGLDTLAKDIVMAGAGVSSGASAGPLSSHFSPVMPYRRGDVGDETRAGVFYRPDAITVLYVPPTHAHTTISRATDLGSELLVEARVNCGPDLHDRLCGFTEQMRVLLFEPRGTFDTLTITDVRGEELLMQHGVALSSTYSDPDTVVAEVASHTYYLKTDVPTGTFQLMHYDGYQTDFPIVDNVVKLEFEYFGDPLPPRVIPDVASVVEKRRTTYGPKPPPLDVDEPNDSWGTGENCVFAVVSGAYVPRLDALAGGRALVALSPTMFEDGPWCPDAASERRFDADLLRIRRVRMLLRVQAASASLRGPAGVLFTRGGTLSSAERFVPDQQVRLDITPRNLEAARAW